MTCFPQAIYQPGGEIKLTVEINQLLQDFLELICSECDSECDFLVS